MLLPLPLLVTNFCLAALAEVATPAESCPAGGCGGLDIPSYSFDLTDPNADYNSMGIERFDAKDFAQAEVYFKVRSEGRGCTEVHGDSHLSAGASTALLPPPPAYPTDMHCMVLWLNPSPPPPPSSLPLPRPACVLPRLGCYRHRPGATSGPTLASSCSSRPRLR